MTKLAKNLVDFGKQHKSSAKQVGTSIPILLTTFFSQKFNTFHLSYLLSNAVIKDDDFFQHLAMIGHSPISFVAMIIDRQTSLFSKLWPMSRRQRLENMEYLYRFTTLYLAKLGDGKNGPKGVIQSFQSSNKMDDRVTKSTEDMIRKAKKLIQQGTSVDELILNNVSPYIYAKIVVENAVGKSLKKGTFNPSKESFNEYFKAYTIDLRILQKEAWEIIF